MRNLHKTAVLLALALAVTSAMTACRDGQDTHSETKSSTVAANNSAIKPSTGNAAVTAEAETVPEITVAESPVAGIYNATTETIITLGEQTAVSGKGAVTEGSDVIITRAGTYLLSGTLDGGQIIVDTEDEEKVTLILNGVSVACSDGPAIYVKSAPKKVVFFTTEGSVNLFSDGSDYIVPDEEQAEGEVYPNACIYSCDDLELSGSGELYILGNADKGINTKDDLKIKGGLITVISAGVGIRANDSLTVSGGTVTVEAGGDGIKTANTETEGKGFLTVEGGSLFVTAKGDGLSAATDRSETW